VYLAAIAGVTAGATAAAALGATEVSTASRVAWSIAIALCASQFAVAIVQWIAMLVVRPNVLSRLDFAKGIPPEHRTIVAVPTMLTSAQSIDELVAALEVRFLANRDANLAFALATDFADAPQQHLDGDAALLQRAVEAIEALERKYPDPARGGGFFLFHRERRWNPRERAWMGWERKRGKLEDLNATLCGESRFATVVGPTDRLRDTKYVIVLDSDTELPRDSARALAGTLAHPLNRPVFDPKVGRVTAGYAILQPRVAISLASAGASRFARLCSGDCTIDPYTAAVSDVYQDVFGEGSFVGKGIYDIAAVRQSMGETFPENRILSHDLLEGAYGRSGLISDVILLEDYPAAYAADANRRARWIRGDWQIARWLFRRVPGGSGRRRNPISLLSQWKVLDNLRRSLVPIGQLALVGFALVVPSLAWISLLVVASTLFVPGFVASLGALARRPPEVAPHLHAREVAAQAVDQCTREAFAFACLPAEAALNLTSIVVATARVLITKRNLLEWRTAADAQRSARTSLSGAYASSWISPAAAVAIGVAIGLGWIRDLWLAVPIAALWAAAPALVWWVSRPIEAPRAELSDGDRTFLRALARRTWRFFEVYVGAEDHDLPPDNVQEHPPVGVAHRTSPTNIGLSLLANLAAYDFGYVATGEVIARTTRTFTTLGKLQRYRGHFYNWYDTLTLEPLRPMYVSTVDSGNLAGHLLTLAAGLTELGDHRILRNEYLAGLGDTLDLLAQHGVAAPALAPARALLATAPSTLSSERARLTALAAAARELLTVIAAEAAEPMWWGRAFEKQCKDLAAELDYIAPWLALQATPGGDLRRRLDDIPRLAETARLEAVLAPLLAADPKVAAAVALGAERATLRLTELRDLAARAIELGDYDYEMLYDRSRHLLAIGYNIVDHRLDNSFYDLLASEARLASYVAIAQGKLPQEHWFHLGRLVTTSSGGTALLSWSGSMFEYLMPMLVMPTYEGTLLDQTCRVAVARQIEYGREHDVPWGVSESGYYKTDNHQNYQYRAFGVPGLGFKRGLADDLVIAPYACVMGLMVAPEAACANLKVLAANERLGDYGFFEAIDYTTTRLPPGKTSVTVQSYMAHHQGMSLLSLVYVLADRPMQRRFDADLALRATNLLLQERVPRASTVFPHPAEVTAVRTTSVAVEDHIRVFTTPNTSHPEVHLLSNGHYHVAITNAGGGYSKWRELAVTRWQEDATRDAAGTFCYVRDVTTGKFWSTAHQPTLRAATDYEAVFSQGRAEFRRRDEEIACHVEISVSPEDDIELRRISISNHGRTDRTIELTSFAEVVLATPAADAAHRTFSNLFVQTELDRARHAILCTRRPRSGGEKPPWMFHLMVAYDPTVNPTSFETNRAVFIGRGGSLEDPAAMHVDALTDSWGSVLDPIVAIRNIVELAPDQMIQLQIVTGMAETRAQAIALIDKYNDRHAADRVLEMSWTQTQVTQRRLEATSAEMRAWERLAGHIIYLNPALRAPKSVIASNQLGQSGLWAYGISGDLPIVLVQITSHDNLDLVKQLIRAHAYWRLKGLIVDLVIWNEDASGYRQNLHEQIMAAIASTGEASLVDKPGGVFLRRSDQMTAPDRVLMQTLARVIIDDTAGTITEQLDRRVRAEPTGAPLITKPNKHKPAPIPTVDRPDLTSFNGHGGFTQDGREYVIVSHREMQTPAPWVNVIANSYFGTVISERGSAYTWCENAHQYRLTPWNNDPVGDPSGEAVYLRDEEDGTVWSPTPAPAPGSAPYTTRHGFGYTVFETSHNGIASELRTFVAIDAPAKFLVLKLTNRSGRARQLSVTSMFDLVLGSQRPAGAPHVVSEVDVKTGALFSKNPYAEEFSGRIAFLECSEDQRWVSGDRLEFLGRNGTFGRPAAMARARLSGRVGAALDPCLAMQTMIELADGGEREIVFLFGSGRDLADARYIVSRFRGAGAAQAALEAVWAYWNRTLGAINVQTPDAALNFLANGWLVYQVLACRMWGRSGFYQSGGAFGFRDQLQDAMALLYSEPALLREQLVRASAHQFSQGDVQHWWHPPVGRG
ncbi:MAG: cyclic beta 1-2 glucan synthetase, partial [Deltaproteobacteria bacterium]|nr:cyclic beta 1-2 glucan synthetase [Deltaproteobacteria bacterium]